MLAVYCMWRYSIFIRLRLYENVSFDWDQLTRPVKMQGVLVMDSDVAFHKCDSAEERLCF